MRWQINSRHNLSPELSLPSTESKSRIEQSWRYAAKKQFTPQILTSTQKFSACGELLNDSNDLILPSYSLIDFRYNKQSIPFLIAFVSLTAM
mmetsp:Transcript_118401/g.241986  ORF Transcript_118401/g.241986 Transcript_118401/m.241986 type:complete len:92 (+) Transcript_118401:2258-2533(+)